MLLRRISPSTRQVMQSLRVTADEISLVARPGSESATKRGLKKLSGIGVELIELCAFTPQLPDCFGFLALSHGIPVLELYELQKSPP